VPWQCQCRYHNVLPRPLPARRHRCRHLSQPLNSHPAGPHRTSAAPLPDRLPVTIASHRIASHNPTSSDGPSSPPSTSLTDQDMPVWQPAYLSLPAPGPWPMAVTVTKTSERALHGGEGGRGTSTNKQRAASFCSNTTAAYQTRRRRGSGRRYSRQRCERRPTGALPVFCPGPAEGEQIT